MPGYKSDIRDVVIKLNAKFKKAKVSDSLLREIATTLQASNIRRVMTDGKAVSGVPIGKYSTKDTLAGRKSFRTAGGFNKIAGSKKKRTALDWRTLGKRHLFIVEGGYKKIRELDGDPTDKVNLRRTGNLMRGWVIEKTTTGWAIGFSAEIDTIIAEEQEKNFDKQIFGVGTEDEAVILQILDQHFNHALK